MAHQDALGLRFVLGLGKQEGGLEHAAAELVVAPPEAAAACIPGGGKQLPLDPLVVLQAAHTAVSVGAGDVRWMMASEAMSEHSGLAAQVAAYNICEAVRVLVRAGGQLTMTMTCM